jgi:hypothetical protein
MGLKRRDRISTNTIRKAMVNRLDLEPLAKVIHHLIEDVSGSLEECNFLCPGPHWASD